MQEIKFKFWNKISKKFEDNSFDDALDANNEIKRIQESFEMCQYTCIKDKNNIEIYEDDIVTLQAKYFDKNHRLQYVPFIHTAHIIFEDNEARFSAKCIPHRCFDAHNNVFRNCQLGEGGRFSLNNGVELIIIGNKQENPELLQ